MVTRRSSSELTRSTTPRETNRSSRRVKPLGERRISSARSVIRSRLSAASERRTSTPYSPSETSCNSTNSASSESRISASTSTMLRHANISSGLSHLAMVLLMLLRSLSASPLRPQPFSAGSDFAFCRKAARLECRCFPRWTLNPKRSQPG
jgi:hypothetical protein